MLRDARVLTIGVSAYTDSALNRHGPAAGAARFAREACQAGVSPENITAVVSRLPDESADFPPGVPAAADASVANIRDALRELAGKRASALLVYWCGHGFLFGTRYHALLARESLLDQPATFEIADILDYLRGHQFAGLGEQVFFFDACAHYVDAPRSWGTRTYLRTLSQDWNTNVSQRMYLSARAGQTAAIDETTGTTKFSNALFEWLGRQPRDGASPPPWHDLQAIFKTALAGEAQQASLEVSDPSGDSSVTYTHAPTHIEVLESTRLSDLVDVFGRAATPFFGRGAARDDIVRWLDDPRSSRLRIVTGDAGSGKTALLGALAVSSERQGWFSDGLPTPPLRSLDAAIYAKGLTPSQVVARIAHRCGLSSSELSDILARLDDPKKAVDALLSHRLPPAVVLVDAVEEAEQRDVLYRDVLIRIAAAPEANVRLLLGLRREGLAEFDLARVKAGMGRIDGSDVIDLDHGGFADPQGLRIYIRHLLADLHSDTGPVWPDATEPQRQRRDRVVEAIAVRGAQDRSFLAAETIARGMTDADVADDPRWIASLPQSAGAALIDHIRRRYGDTSTDALAVFLPLAYARGEGMPQTVLRQGLVTALSPATTLTELDVGRLLEGSDSYLEHRDVNQDLRHRLRTETLAASLRAGRDEVADEAAITRQLIGGVGPGAHGRDWQHASSYVTTHLIAHAVRAQDEQVYSLLTDGGFLIAANSAQVLTHCASIDDGPLRAALAAYRDSLPLVGTTEQKAARLLFAARCRRADTLAESLMPFVGPTPGVTSTVWAAWRQETPHRRLSTHPRHSRLLATATTAYRAVLLSASGDNLHHWVLDAETDRSTVLSTDRVDCLAVEQGGPKPLAVVAHDTSLSVWDPVTGALESRRPSALPAAVRALATTWQDDTLVIIAGDAAGNVHQLLWNGHRWAARQPSEPSHTRAVTALAVVGHGSEARLVSASLDGNVVSRGLLTANGAERYLGHARIVRSLVAIVNDQRRAVASAGEDGIVRIWDPFEPAKPGLALTGHDGWVRALAQVRLGGRSLLLSGGDDGRVIVWDADTGARVGAAYQGHRDRVNALAVALLDGRATVASAGARGAIRVWELTEAGPIGEPFHGHSGAVRALGVLPVAGDTDRLISASSDGTVTLWDGYVGLPLGRPLTGHTSWVGAIATLPDGGEVVTAGGDGQVLGARLIRTHLEPMAQPLAEQPGGWTSALTTVDSSGGQRLLWARCEHSTSPASPPVVWALDQLSAEPRPIYSGHSARIRTMASVRIDQPGHPPRRLVISAGADPDLHVWDAATGAAVARVQTGADGDIRALAVTADGGGTVVLAAGDDGRIRPFRPGEPAETEWLRGEPWMAHPGGVEALAVADDDPATVISGGDDGAIHRWWISGHAQRDSLSPPHAGPVRSLAIGRRAGRTVVYSGSADTTINAWYLDDGRVVLPAHSDWVRCVATGAADGQDIIVSASDDGTLRAWAVADGTQLWTRAHAHGRAVRAVVCIHADGHAMVVSGSTAGDLRVWDLATGQPQCAPLAGHDDWVRCLAAAPGGGPVVSGGGDGAVRAWRWDGAALRADGERAGAGARPWIRAIALAETGDGWRIVASGEDKRLIATDLHGNSQAAIHDDVRAVAVLRLAGSAVALFGGPDGVIRAWHPASDRVEDVVPLGTGEVTALAAHDGAPGELWPRARLAVGTGRVLSMLSWTERTRVWSQDWSLNVGAEVLSLAFTQDAGRLVLGTRMGVAVVQAR